MRVMGDATAAPCNCSKNLPWNWKYTDTIIMGDFNMHINDPTDRDATVFMDTLEAMGLDQNVTFDMHQKGNTLDLVFTEVKSGLQVNRCDPGPFISDHRAVLIELSM